MKQLTILALALCLATACSKKDDKAKGAGSAAPAPTGSAGTGAATQPTDPGSAGSDSTNPAGSAGGAAALTAADMLEAPPGSPKDCAAFREQLVKYKDCEAAAGKDGMMFKAWNDMVKGSLGSTYERASADNKKTIESSCTKMVELSKMYPTLCK